MTREEVLMALLLRKRIKSKQWSRGSWVLVMVVLPAFVRVVTRTPVLVDL